MNAQTIAGPLTPDQAKAIWSILVDECGADSEHGFIDHQTREYVTEWRFIGALGFGGKFWRNQTRRPDGSWGETWYVTYYREHETPERHVMQNAANERLWRLLADIEAAA